MADRRPLLLDANGKPLRPGAPFGWVSSADMLEAEPQPLMFGPDDELEVRPRFTRPPPTAPEE